MALTEWWRQYLLLNVHPEFYEPHWAPVWLVVAFAWYRPLFKFYCDFLKKQIDINGYNTQFIECDYSPEYQKQSTVAMFVIDTKILLTSCTNLSWWLPCPSQSHNIQSRPIRIERFFWEKLLSLLIGRRTSRAARQSRPRESCLTAAQSPDHIGCIYYNIKIILCTIVLPRTTCHGYQLGYLIYGIQII